MPQTMQPIHEEFAASHCNEINLSTNDAFHLADLPVNGQIKPYFEMLCIKNSDNTKVSKFFIHLQYPPVPGVRDLFVFEHLLQNILIVETGFHCLVEGW